jgi:hypothetical protein
MNGGDRGGWPEVLGSGGPGSECFVPVDIGKPADPVAADALKDTHVYRIVCP